MSIISFLKFLVNMFGETFFDYCLIIVEYHIQLNRFFFPGDRVTSISMNRVLMSELQYWNTAAFIIWFYIGSSRGQAFGVSRTTFG